MIGTSLVELKPNLSEQKEKWTSLVDGPISKLELRRNEVLLGCRLLAPRRGSADSKKFILLPFARNRLRAIIPLSSLKKHNEEN
jgi:hypothetical protein